MRKGQAAIPVTVMLYGKELSTVDSYAKDMGYPSRSAAMRRIVNEWVALKSENLDPRLRHAGMTGGNHESHSYENHV